MGKTAFIFPGQGAQAVGMGKDVYEKSAPAKEMFDRASEAVGLDLKALCFEENEDINITEFTQVCLLTTSVAILKEIENRGGRADVAGGLSLGEYCALVANGAMDAIDVEGMVGTIAGDDTAFIAMKDNASAQSLYSEIRNLF